MYIWCVLTVFAAVVGGSEIYYRIADRKKDERRLCKKTFLSTSRKNMFKRLREAYPEALIFSQVPYGDLLDSRKKNAKEKARMLLRFQGCRVDFVLCDDSLTPFCLIKFDETPQEKKKLKKLTSEEVFHEAGYKFLRYKNTPSVERLKNDIDAP